VTYVIGVGRDDRGDDAAGWLVLDGLPPDTEHTRHDGEPVSLLEELRDHRFVILIDAAVGAGPPGTVMRVDAGSTPIPATVCRSSHSVGLAEVIELARIFGDLPERLIVYLIEGERFDVGAEPSRAVLDSVGQAVTLITAELTGG
jgi:hydrogenase maturation protease